ncbi:MAG: hypothetical protein IKU82_01780 [Clostridia bacterium]|nr:hypothetical protein [Clostridia bacterium]
MKKIKNILLLSGICLYAINVLLELLVFLPNISSFAKSIIPYVITSIFICALKIAIVVVLPTILLCLNLKDKFSKIFTIIVIILSAISNVFLLVDPYLSAIPQYLIFSKLGLVDTWFIYLLSGSGILCLISSILITVGAILSIKKKNS